MRVFAAFAVIVIHVASGNMGNVGIRTFEWGVLNFYDSIVRWAVPVFVMISGTLFLSKDVAFRKIFSKYILRIVTAFLFWSSIYAVAYYIKNGDGIKALGYFIVGHYHLWFLFMITGLYMVVPFMKKIAESEFLTKYFLVLAFVFAFLIPQSISLISFFSEKYGKFANVVVNQLQFRFAMGFTGYFLLGYVLNKIEICKRHERVVYLLGICGFFATILMTATASSFRIVEIFYDNITTGILLESVAVFVFFKKHFFKSSKFVLALSKYSFGAYLVHDAVRLVVSKFGLTPLSFNPIFSVPVVSLIVFVISFAISCVLNQIPVLKKYIV